VATTRGQEIHQTHRRHPTLHCHMLGWITIQDVLQ
jgi:hypothetical protein